MLKFQTSFENNTAKANTLIDNLGSSLKIVKEALEKVRTFLQKDNTIFQAIIYSQIEKLHTDLAMENKIVNELTIKTDKVKVLSVKLNQVNMQIDEGKFKKAVMQSYVADINSLLSNIVESCYPLIHITIKRHQANKLRPAFPMLNML